MGSGRNNRENLRRMDKKRPGMILNTTANLRVKDLSLEWAELNFKKPI